LTIGGFRLSTSAARYAAATAAIPEGARSDTRNL
jgi:hypothetical protein